MYIAVGREEMGRLIGMLVIPTGCPTSGVSGDGRQVEQAVLEGGGSIPSIMGASLEVLADDRFVVAPATQRMADSCVRCGSGSAGC